MIINEYIPDWVSPPGDTIQDLLDEQSMSRAELAYQLGYSEESVGALLRGELELSLYIAKGLVHIFGSSEGFWLNREKHYRENLRQSLRVKA